MRYTLRYYQVADVKLKTFFFKSVMSMKAEILIQIAKTFVQCIYSENIKLWVGKDTFIQMTE